MLGKNTLKETTKLNGKIFKILKMKVASDGKSMKVVEDCKFSGTKSSATAMKQ
jgi:hypothetical protein